MINIKDVITIKIPYPSISSDLAISSHMYMCNDNDIKNFILIKCQTLKPYMLKNEIMTHFIDENPNASRNPFKRATRIDCDKVFKSTMVIYDDSLKASRNICDELFNSINEELNKDGYKIINLNEQELVLINNKIHKIK